MKVFVTLLLFSISVVIISSCHIYGYTVFINPDFSNNQLTEPLLHKYSNNGVIVKPRIMFSDGKQKDYELFFLFLSKNGKEKVRIVSYEVSMEKRMLSDEKVFNTYSDSWEYFEENDGFFSSSIQGKKIEHIKSDTIKEGSRMDITFIMQVIDEEGSLTEKEISTYFISEKQYFVE